MPNYRKVIPNTDILNTIKNRFYSNVLLPNENGCMEWIAALTGGYGRFYGHDRYISAHRYSYELFNEKILNDLCVLHKCDNRKCVNPEHLFLGTKAENIKDAFYKNRQAKGERQGFSKLTEKQVIEIKQKINKGIVNRKIALEYKVSPQAVCLIKKQKNWKHVLPKIISGETK